MPENLPVLCPLCLGQLLLKLHPFAGVFEDLPSSALMLYCPSDKGCLWAKTYVPGPGLVGFPKHKT